MDVSENEAHLRLRALNANFIHNFITNDVASHRRITHEEFVCVTPEGGRQGGAEYLARWATAFDPDVIPYFDYRDECINIFGPFALMWSVNKHTFISDGQEATEVTAYTDTYLLQDGEWRCIHAQLTRVTPENYPPDETIVKQYIRGKAQR